jgi:hypothetical protein
MIQKEKKMTWRELKNFINKQARLNKDFLETDVKLYNYENGDENDVDITELLCNDDESENDNSNWVPYLSINDEEQDNETETEEASID